MSNIGMDEKQFVAGIVKKLKEQFEGDKRDIHISEGESLLYKLFVDATGKIMPELPPSRGKYAFQTDILIKKGDMPQVVIEAKYDSLTTHDVITYSSKALRHKEIYPYLRYGLVVGGMKGVIESRFFTHNSGFDFAVSLTKDDIISELLPLIETQIEASEKLLGIMGKEKKISKFENRLFIE